jgi:hypothetical protein
MEPGRLTEDYVIQNGGWSRQYARVRLIVQDGDVAMALVDGNGDGAEYEIEAWSVTRHEDGTILPPRAWDHLVAIRAGQP